ncbi:MAG: MarR family transcriptional regulator [Labilithrix sp.]
MVGLPTIKIGPPREGAPPAGARGMARARARGHAPHRVPGEATPPPHRRVRASRAPQGGRHDRGALRSPLPRPAGGALAGSRGPANQRAPRRDVPARDHAAPRPCRTTVSKMLTRLEQMGWVRRVRDGKDRRKKRVFFTALGLRQTAHAMRIVFRQRKFLARFELIARKRWPYKKEVVRALQDIWGELDFLAGAFADQSMVHYHMGIDEPAGCEWPETPDPTWFLEERSQRWVKPPPPPERWPARPWIPARN